MLQFSCAAVDPTVADFLPVFDIPGVSAVAAVVPTAVDVTSNISAVVIPAVANVPDVANVSMPSSAN
jgi:hypothetical protein